MNYKIKTVCRGRGAAYVLIAISGQSRQSLRNCTWAALSGEGVRIPLLHYWLSAGEGDSADALLVVPLLNVRSVAFSMYAADDVAREHALLSFSMASAKIKWASRYNYRFNSESAHDIRDFEQLAYSGQFRVTSQMYIQAPWAGVDVIRGLVEFPKWITDVELKMLDGAGNVLEDFPIIITSTGESYPRGLELSSRSFTVRIPRDSNDTYCVVATSKATGRCGFLCLDPAARCVYRDSQGPLYYPSTLPGSYRPRVRERAILAMTANPEDYRIDDGPTFSIVVPLYKTPIPFLKAMIHSVQDQIYSNWELLLVNASPEDAGIADELTKQTDSRIHVIGLAGNLGISGNTNKGIEAATGDYLVFFDHDDLLDRFALYEYAKFIKDKPDTDALYCDEDFLTEDGEYTTPHFKSDFNLDLLRCHNYITHLLAVRMDYAKELMLRSEFDGSQDYDFLLRLAEKTRKFGHVKEVLYHWRISDTSTAKSSDNKGYANEAGRRALQDHLDRCGIKAHVESGVASCYYHTTYEVEGEPLVSIIIPNKDNADVLARCIDSIMEKSTYRAFEIIVVENNSTEPETFAYYREVESRYSQVKVVFWKDEFNYSLINNFGAEQARGEYYLLLNNDTEVINPHWMEAMLGYCQREDVGIVGAKLLYPDDTVQHVGVTMVKCQQINELGTPMHVFCNLDKDDPGYMYRASLAQDLSAVTAACMMTKASVYEELGGLQGKYRVAFNDVDYCFRVREKGLLVVMNPDALLYHYESVSRGSDETGENAMRFMHEQCMLRSDWTKYYANGDPYHHPACTTGYFPIMV